MEESGMGNHIWTRRDWVGAVGAGLASTAFAACPGAETTGVKLVEVYFHGAFLVTRVQDKYIQILIPKTASPVGSAPVQHADTSDAFRHSLFLGAFDDPQHGKPKRGSKVELTPPDITLEATADRVEGTLGPRFINFQDFVEEPIEIREFDTSDRWGHYASRITLHGGTIYPWFAEQSLGTWEFEPTLKTILCITPPCLYSIENPAIGLIWKSGKEEVAVTNVKTGEVLKTIKGRNDPISVIGHSRFDPDHWNHDPKEIVLPGYVDNDFKWLYQILVPKGTKPDNRYPWNGRLNYQRLPAPKYKTSAPPFNAGSPTCFGGCYGCE